MYNDLKRLYLDHMMLTETFESNKNCNKVLHESHLFMPLSLSEKNIFIHKMYQSSSQFLLNTVIEKSTQKN